MSTKLLPNTRDARGTAARDIRLKQHFKVDFLTAREAIGQTEKYLTRQGATPCLTSSVQIVLAEVLTNIFRHGYCGESGDVWLDIQLRSDVVAMQVTDLGIPFNPAVLGHRAPALESLPEGGYGWFMIRQLCSDISYSRDACRNCLILQVLHMPQVSETAHGESRVILTKDRNRTIS